MKTKFLFLFIIYTVKFMSQVRDTAAPVIFGKYRADFMGRLLAIEPAGKFAFAFNKPYFLDLKVPLKERRYESCGLLYYKFQRYCNKKHIYYNKRELRRYRCRASLAGFFYLLACCGFVPIAIDAENYKAKSGYAGKVNFFTSPNAPFLWSLIVVEGVTAGLIKTSAERKLVKRLFLPDSVLKKNKIKSTDTIPELKSKIRN